MKSKKFAKTYFRILPVEKMAWDYLKVLNDHRTVYIRCLQELAKSKGSAAPTFWTFRAERVFFNQSQREVYDEIMPEVLDNIHQGCDAVIMAYGQTGTGKSLTINGIRNAYEDRGILPRVASTLFESLKTDTAKDTVKERIQVSYVEFLKTGFHDLSRPSPNHVHSLKDICKVPVRNVEEAFKIIFKGEGRKVFSQSSSYESHSCSSIFTFHITKKDEAMQANCTRRCKLHIVDLAGVDTVGNFSCLFKKSFEIGTANLAKTQLEQFFLVLCSDLPEHVRVKQRLHPIVFYLGESLSKTSVVRLVGHIRTTREDLLITISMLKFGQLVGGLKSIKFEMKIDEEVSRDRLDSLQKELARLKLENQYNTVLMRQDLSKSLNEERFAHIERTVNEYLQNKITQLTLLNVCDINIALEVMKAICKRNAEDTSTKEDTSKSKNTSKPPRLSSKTSSSEVVVKKSSDEKSKRSFSASTDSKGIVKDLHPQERTSSKTKSRTSASSLPKRSSRRKSSSRASLRDRPASKSKDGVTLVQVPPEYHEAWTSYLQEHDDVYSSFVRLYETNEAAAKNVHRTYLEELDNLRRIGSRVEKHRKDLFLVRMTREFQQACQDGGDRTTTIDDFEKCYMEELEKSQRELIEKQELVLKYQTELKAHINHCKDLRNDLQNHFDDFCTANYQTQVVSLEPADKTMDIVENLTQEEEIGQQDFEEDEEAKMFISLKPLIEVEKRKKRLYQMKHREWVTY